jgi:hypothetical protein
MPTVIIYCMNKLYFLALLVAFPLWAQVSDSDTPVMTTEVVEDHDFNPRKSHWLTTFGFETLQYPTFYEFEGKKNFSPGKQELFGGRIGFGGEIYLGAGLMTTSKIEAFYLGTLFSRTLNGGAEDEDVKFAFTKKTGQLFGAEASQSLGFMFDMKTKNPFIDEWAYLTVEPFIEAGIGQAMALNKLNYSYNLATTDESYKLRVRDELLNAKLAFGINLTSRSGYYLTLKVTQNRFDLRKREARQLIKENGQGEVSSVPDFGDKIDMITTYAIGGGYKF